MNTAAAWGKFAAEILSGNWDGAMEELNKVKDLINDRVRRSLMSSNIVILWPDHTIISSDVVDPLVPVPVLQHRKRSWGPLWTFLFPRLHQLHSNLLTMDHPLSHGRSSNLASPQTQYQQLPETDPRTRPHHQTRNIPILGSNHRVYLCVVRGLRFRAGTKEVESSWDCLEKWFLPRQFGGWIRGVCKTFDFGIVLSDSSSHRYQRSLATVEFVTRGWWKVDCQFGAWNEIRCKDWL